MLILLGQLILLDFPYFRSSQTVIMKYFCASNFVLHVNTDLMEVPVILNILFCSFSRFEMYTSLFMDEYSSKRAVDRIVVCKRDLVLR